jgi:hypothetical protein
VGRRIFALPLAVVLTAVVVPAAVQAQPADTCIQGFLWREANPTDHVCVQGGMAHEVHVQNLHPTDNQVPGSNTCVSGFVWREAFDGDTVCVSPDFRANVRADNAAAASRVVGNAPASGPGDNGGHHHVFLVMDTTYTVQLGSVMVDPLGIDEQWHRTDPWTRWVDIGPDTTYLSLKGWAAGKVTCRINMDGVVVAENSGSFAWCKWGNP